MNTSQFTYTFYCGWTSGLYLVLFGRLTKHHPFNIDLFCEILNNWDYRRKRAGIHWLAQLLVLSRGFNPWIDQ